MPHTIEAILPKERALVKDNFENLLASMSSKLQGDDESLLVRSFALADEAHQYQRRKSGEPYMHHPIEVARICHQEIGLGPTAIACALLHDVVEDTEVSLEDIRQRFGEKVARIVDGLTKLDGLYQVESPQAENLKKVLSSLIYDVRVVLIKMADRVHNLRTIGSMPQHKQIKIAAETSFIYAPLAHRLGLYSIKTEFEDRCMKITEPEFYEDIKNKLAASKASRESYIKSFIDPLKPKLADLCIPFRVQGRPKSIFSIGKKIKTKNIPFEEIYDLFAVRIIVDVPVEKEKNACWQVYSVFTDVYKPIPERLKDWVTTPKGNGYESLHTTVIGPHGKFVEVQIRSERMDEIAEKGFAAHWKYKGVDDQHNVFDSWLDGIRDLLGTQHSNAVEFLNDFRTNLFSEEVYVFTPNGDMRILPKGATALDFAFEIHTDVGYRATAIKVNNKLVPMGTKLRNGDQVSVITNAKQKPSENWLNLVVTGKARSKIRSSMKEEMKRLGEFGKETIMRKLRHRKVDFESNIDFLVKHFGYQSRPDFYYAISKDEFKVSELQKLEVVNGKLTPKKEPEGIFQRVLNSIPSIPSTKKAEKQEEENKNFILINGESASQYTFQISQCCNPVPGDEIFGFISNNAGLKIHRNNCPNAQHLMANYSYRILKADWSGSANKNFVVELLVTGLDSGPGVIQQLTNTISNELGINIRSFSIEAVEGYFEGKVSMMVKNKDQLQMVIQTLKKIDNIDNVTRIHNES